MSPTAPPPGIAAHEYGRSRTQRLWLKLFATLIIKIYTTPSTREGYSFGEGGMPVAVLKSINCDSPIGVDAFIGFV